MLSPRRTFSSSTSGVCCDYSARHPFRGIDCQRSTVTLEPGNDVEHVDPRKPLAARAVLKESARLDKNDKLPLLEPNMRKESGQDIVSKATLIDQEVKRPSRLRRMIGHLRKTGTTHR